MFDKIIKFLVGEDTEDIEDYISEYSNYTELRKVVGEYDFTFILSNQDREREIEALIYLFDNNFLGDIYRK